MFEVGDIVECIESHTHSTGSPSISKGQRFVVNGIFECNCLRGLDIGLKVNKNPMHRTCRKCGFISTVKNNIAYFHSKLFRKIEPEYKVVEVSEEINKQVKELILS